MEIIIGRLGDQRIQINEPTVSRHHCKIETDESGRIFIEDIGSANGTYVNGEKVSRREVSKLDKVSLGPHFSSTIGELMVSRVKKESVPAPAKYDDSAHVPAIDIKDAKQYTDYKLVLKDHKKLSELVNMLSAAEYEEKSIPSYVIPVIMTAVAAKHIRSGKHSSAQDLLYKAGDKLYALQNGSAVMECCYASIMALLADLYLSVFKYHEAEVAGKNAVGIYNRWLPGTDVPYYLVAEAYEIYADALRNVGKERYALKCYDKAIELYRLAGSIDPSLYSAKIVEIKQKVNK